MADSILSSPSDPLSTTPPPPRVLPEPFGRAAADGDSLGAERLADARRGYATRRMALAGEYVLRREGVSPAPGDLVLARVEGIGHHARLELPSGRRAHLNVGDEIIVSYGNRYAPDQFEAEVPADLGSCHLVAAGGLAARLLNKHGAVRNPTRLQPLGLLADTAGAVLNLRAARLAARALPQQLPPVVAVVGTAMNAGKTTAVARLITGLRRAGKRVGAAKITGTASGGDQWRMLDAGAREVVDFTDAGHASTYRLPPHEVEMILLQLLTHLGERQLDAIVLEIADGILQAETSALLASPSFGFYCNRVIFAAGDAMGALAGTAWLRERGLRVVAVSGALTASPLAVREAAAATGLPVYTKQQLSEPGRARRLLSLGA